MPNTSTIGAGGGFSLLQSFETAKDGLGTQEWGSLLLGADIGPCNFAGWSWSPTGVGDDYLRIFTPTAQRDTRLANSGGAYLAIANGAGAYGLQVTDVDNVKIEGLIVKTSTTSHRGGIYSGYAGSTFILDGCMMVILHDANPFYGGLWSEDLGAADFRNCIHYGAGTANCNGIRNDSTGAGTWNAYLRNCTVLSSDVQGFAGYEGGGVLNLNYENCLALVSSINDYSPESGAATPVFDNNMSEDGTAGSHGGNDNQPNVTAADQVVHVTDDATLKVGSDAIGTGKDLSGTFLNDARGSDSLRDGWGIGALANAILPPETGPPIGSHMLLGAGR